MFSNIGFTEILLILLIIIILFGPKKIPELAQSLGKGIREFKKAIEDAKDNVIEDKKDTPKDENK
ncbi:MAG TPA: twin-arginine translocase TatA/TatE family subunit [Ignavibacteriales bacterium]|jgi:TatA/E family protein of Tat protein translocase|nr:twin-arginine translocase TatA/TatE family subunit [Ignavibacteriales bacterium]